jgi:hypothetical protein
LARGFAFPASGAPLKKRTIAQRDCQTSAVMGDGVCNLHFQKTILLLQNRREGETERETERERK